MSAPSVNQIRFFSSSALANAEKLRFAASCSAAETMVGSVCDLFLGYDRVFPAIRTLPSEAKVAAVRHKAGRGDKSTQAVVSLGSPSALPAAAFPPLFFAPCPNAAKAFLPFGSAGASFLGAKILTEPPALSTAARADFEAPKTTI